MPYIPTNQKRNTTNVRVEKFSFIFTQALNFIVVLITFTVETENLIYQLVKDGFWGYSPPSFVLYFGTLLPLYINEQIYETFEAHSKSHKVLSVVLIASTIFSFIGLSLRFYPELVLIFFIIHTIILSSFFVATIAYAVKIYHMWHYNPISDKPIRELNSLPSSFFLDLYR